MNIHQQPFEVNLDWGKSGLHALLAHSDVVIIVDVLSFSTSVDIVTAQGGLVFPYNYKDESVIEYAKKQNAVIANPQRSAKKALTLSPTSLLKIDKGTRLVLPSPNGSTLSLATDGVPTICGCIRNAKAVASYAMTLGKSIALIPAGEQWPDGTIRFAFEDLMGAGAILSHLSGTFSPECKSALMLFNGLKHYLLEEVKESSSGRELLDRGFEKDVALACALNVSQAVPLLENGCFKDASEKEQRP